MLVVRDFFRWVRANLADELLCANPAYISFALIGKDKQCIRFLVVVRIGGADVFRAGRAILAVVRASPLSGNRVEAKTDVLRRNKCGEEAWKATLMTECANLNVDPGLLDALQKTFAEMDLSS